MHAGRRAGRWWHRKSTLQVFTCYSGNSCTFKTAVFGVCVLPKEQEHRTYQPLTKPANPHQGARSLASNGLLEAPHNVQGGLKSNRPCRTTTHCVRVVKLLSL